MSLWLRFAIVNLEDLQEGGVVAPLKVLDLDSDRESFIATVHPLYQELVPLFGTPAPSSFRLESVDSFEGLWCDGQTQPLSYYTREEMMQALDKAREYGYEKNERDQDLWNAVDTLPEGKVLVKILFT